MASSSEFDSINDYNKYLINNNKTDVTIKDYIINIKNMFYPDMDISFMDFFMNLVGNNNICISQQKLIDYSVISKITPTSRIKELIVEHEFKIDIDYHLADNRKMVNRPQGGGKKKDEYIFTPKAFKICLMRSKNKSKKKKNEEASEEEEEESENEKNKNKYIKYYLLLEEVVEFYNKYQLQSKQSEISRLIKLLEESNKDNKELIKENKEQTKELKLSNKKLDKQSEELKESNKKLDKLEEQNTKLLEELREVKQTLLISSHDRATKVSKSQLNDVLILLKNNNILNNYCSLRTQKKSIKKAIKDKGDQYTVILEFLFNPNSITHNNEVKIQLKKMRIADIYYNNIMLHEDYSEKDLKEIYLKVYEERIINMI